MIFSLDSLAGELEIDHKASPGLTLEQARRAGYRGQLEFLQEGGVARYKTLRCCHCGGCWVENPERSRARNHCLKCHQYMCDGCAVTAGEPDYVHRSADDLKDMITSGRWTCVGGTASKPVLVPVTGA
jgi:hypothetical protein